jgi:hypothetical protein
MSNIKKGFTEVYQILIDNQNKKVSTVMDQLVEIMISKQRDKNHFVDDHGLWIFCYYHKVWELTDQVEYGKKVNTATGLNSMCKVGTNQWTKQQREFKNDRSNLLELVRDGKLAITDIDTKTEELDEIRTSIIPLSEFHHELALNDPRQLVTE